MPCSFNAEYIVGIKSWICYSSWITRNEAKLTALADRLAESKGLYFFREKEFNNSVYLNPL